MLGNLKKHYVGSINSEERAARIYDRHAILTHGLRAKTNYNYTKGQVLAFLSREEEILYNDVHNNEEYTVVFESDGEEERNLLTGSLQKELLPVNTVKLCDD